jgi:hypothetical protein
MSTKTEQELALEANAGQTEKPDYAKEIERLTAQNERLLFESQKNKTRKEELDSYKSQLSEIENKKLEESGEWKKRLGLEQEKTATLNEQLKSQQNKILKSNIYNAVQRLAPEAYDINDLLAQSEYVKSIEVNEETLEPTIESVEKFVSSLRSEKEYFFKGKKVASMADSKAIIDKPLTKNFAQMTEQEKKQAMSDQIAVALKRT